MTLTQNIGAKRRKRLQTQFGQIVAVLRSRSLAGNGVIGRRLARPSRKYQRQAVGHAASGTSSRAGPVRGSLGDRSRVLPRLLWRPRGRALPLPAGDAMSSTPVAARPATFTCDLPCHGGPLSCLVWAPPCPPIPRRPPSMHRRSRRAPPAGPRQKLLDRVRHAIRTRHYSRRTEQAYVD
jgi:hypothetical protein